MVKQASTSSNLRVFVGRSRSFGCFLTLALYLLIAGARDYPTHLLTLSKQELSTYSDFFSIQATDRVSGA